MFETNQVEWTTRRFWCVRVVSLPSQHFCVCVNEKGLAFIDRGECQTLCTKELGSFRFHFVASVPICKKKRHILCHRHEGVVVGAIYHSAIW